MCFVLLGPFHFNFCICIIACMCSEVDLVGLKPILRITTSFSALTLLVGSFDPYKPVPDMTYNVFSGTLNPTQSINQVFRMIIKRAKTC